MRLQKLRLTGFKSFVEPTELAIAPGLTGIVGPNGCGKSNLVEALRWVMGESSAKQLRGGEMDDVIFGGTATRASRSVAEVALRLDQVTHTIPGPLGRQEEVEISRRIARGEGSTYRINGREVRARDVQLMFADAASGARSAAMVSQGQIGTIIAARPDQRRAILEEAAGIGGLHTRRQEAEQRLRAAEQNLERVDDVMSTLDGQLQSLRKQARQTNRYRKLSEQVRQAEAALFFARWEMAEARLGQVAEKLADAEIAVEQAARSAASAASGAQNAAGDVPPLRRKEADALAELRRVQVQREALDAEVRRVAEERKAIQRRLDDLVRDIDLGRSRAADATTAVDRLAQEGSRIEAAQREEAGAKTDAAQRLAAAEADVARLEKDAARLADEVGRAEAGRTALLREFKAAEERAARLRQQRDQFGREREAALAASVASAARAAVEDAAASAEREAGLLSEEADKATEAVGPARAAEAAARESAQRAEMELERLRTEEKTVARLLAATETSAGPPVLDGLSVEPGYETALGAALGDDLTIGTSPEAAAHWRTLEPLASPPALPSGAEPLISHVSGEPALLRRLSQIGVVCDAEAGEALSRDLSPGQRLVTREGGVWRWDGLITAAGRPGATALRLAQRNQLRAVRRRLPDAETAASTAKEAAGSAAQAARDAAGRERTARDLSRTAQATAARRQQELATTLQRATAAEARLSTLDQNLERVGGELATTETNLEEVRASIAGLGDASQMRAEAERVRSTLAGTRRHLLECRSLTERLERDRVARSERMAAIGVEAQSWRQRLAEAGGHLEELERRASAERDRLEASTAAPSEADTRRQEITERIEAAEERQRFAATDLAAAEKRAMEGQDLLKRCEAALAGAREDRVRREAACETAREALETVLGEIRERFSCEPPALQALLPETGAGRDVESAEQRFARLQREREAIGPVNLRADIEMEAITSEIGEITAQREDLTAALGKFRAAIAELNREARGRLSEAFEAVDRHFRELFVTLFGGGRAELTWTDSDDPLAAGLDILASPPGKRLQSLSLLSGGERTLTALALILAVFLTKPAPVCVLDEVDAPLDDANVDRFCQLIEEIAQTTGTRFLVVTHHGLTMARMHRLFGVTMSERGISQLVSVDLRAAEELRATA